MTHRISDWLCSSRYSSPGHEGEGAKSCCKEEELSEPRIQQEDYEHLSTATGEAAQAAVLHVR